MAKIGNPAWKKGVTGNPNGRPKKSGKQQILFYAKIKEFVESDEGMSILFREMKKLQPTEFIRAFLELMQYSTPKLKAIEHMGDRQMPTIEIIGLSTDRNPLLNDPTDDVLN